MIVERIDIEKFLSLSKSLPVLDVRSPAEYNHAHIPGAYSLPLFTDEERKIVGTTYKQQGKEQAIKIGLEFFGPRMKNIVEEVEELLKKTADNHRVLVHCWRGGMRSDAVAWLLNVYGIKVYLLIGGYKRFRRYVLDTFSFPFQFKILGGYTGSNKTGLLKALEGKNEKVIDLESIANHKGSAFGNIGMPTQPGQEMFENLLALELRNKSDDTAIWLEDESQRIGLINIPHQLWKTMRQSPVYFLDIPFDARLQHIVEEYGSLDREKLKEAIGRITQKLGHLNAKNAISFLDEGRVRDAFSILLQYYDRFYFKSLHNREAIQALLHTIKCKSISPENANLLQTAQLLQAEKP